MIRRISKSNDYRDIIKSCPTGVIDDIYSIKYFISGHPETEVEASFTKKGNLLEVILPTSLLIELGNGVLMRRALYMNSDSDFPDGEYNLEFVDDLNVWLGDEEVDPPFDPGYLTEDDLKTINGDSIVGVGNIDVVNYIPSYYVTESWISSQHFASVTYVQNIISSVESGIASDLSSFATQSWVQEQGYLTASTIPSDIATQSWVQSQGYITIGDLPSGLVTQGWLDENSYVNQSMLDTEEYLHCSSLESYNDSYPLLNVSDSGIFIAGYYDVGGGVSGPGGLLVTESGLVGLYSYDVEDQEGNFREFATETWVQSQGYITSSGLSGLATQSWVSSNFLSSGALSGYATQSWVDSNYTRAEDFDDFNRYTLPQYATKQWVSSNFLSSGALSGYATEQFVTSSLSSYATQSWVSSNFLSSGWAEDELSSYALTYDRSNDGLYESDKVYICNGGLLFFDYMGDENGVSGVYLSSSTAGIYGYDSVGQDYVYEPFATQSWVSSQGYLTSVPSGYATQSWVSSQQFATQSWVQSQGYITIGEIPSGLATQSWVQSQGYITSTDLSGYATESWVQNQGYLTQHQDLTGYLHFDENSPLDYDTLPYYGSKVGLFPVTQEDGSIVNVELVENAGWVSMRLACYDVSGQTPVLKWINHFVTEDFMTAYIYTQRYATESWVSSQGYLTSVPSGYATESFVTSALSGYATESWVQSQGYLTSHQDLSSYATQSWVESNYFEESKIWVGSQAAWEQLSYAQQVLYTIALITN